MFRRAKEDLRNAQGTKRRVREERITREERRGEHLKHGMNRNTNDR